jgi:sensor histidine kinase regulating citrate/malate metabolism
MRGWRHDYHNHMQLLKAHLAMGQYEQAKNYLNQLEEDLDSIDVAYKTGNVSLDAILNSKLSVAEKQGIEIHSKATVPEKLAVSDVDLCVVIGNLLDNAMESCEKMKVDEQRFLRVYIGVFKQQLYISVTNSTNEVIRKLDKEYISSKRGNHGHGLKRIDTIVEKYDGFINRKNEPGVFVTEIMLPL